ncbi:DUF6232 family protein [Streptomyces sp. JW3]|uniref:DUF6232 family protein n=1 Tax=Streptomyces sp. JW3 TaxID=3456955 RepID=UPI003FA4B89D
MPPHLEGGVELRVGKRVLWVGGAAYPVANVTRVYTFLLVPQRGAATMLFFKRVGIILVAGAALLLLGELADFLTAGFVVVCAILAVSYCLVELVNVLSAASHWVLAIETSGASTALVTSRDTQHLHQLVGHVVHSIENPGTELVVRVETLAINPRNYHFGDNVNMYGGTGNVGMGKT